MFRNKSNDEILLSSYTAITNAMNIPEIAEVLVRFNYPVERMSEGLNLYTLAQQAYILRSTRMAEQMGCTKALQEARARADTKYMRHLKVARLVFQHNLEVWKTLGLDGVRAEGLGAWLAQGRQFYTNLLSEPAILNALLPYNLTENDLRSGLTLLEETEACFAAREKARGLAIQATHDRDLAFRHLKTWVSTMLAVARLAFEDDPQRLESLGLTIRS